jgi:predicted TIM-barrel fold metal-dependent hydrolase
MKRTDVHCHFFNIQYAFREALVILWDSLRGRYPNNQEREEEDVLTVVEKTAGWIELVKYIASLACTVVRSCEKQYLYEQEKYHESELTDDKEEDIVTAPLMMDIYHIFDKDDAGVPGKTAIEIPKFPKGSPTDIRGAFGTFANELKNDVLEEVSLKGYDRIAERSTDHSSREVMEKITKKLESTIENFITEQSIPLKKGKADIRLSWGYKKHMEDLEKLAGDYKDKVVPFLAVDPRRLNIIKLVREKVDKGPNTPFKGVKLYPALGYLPTHPNLFPVYDFCIELDIPISVHASCGGLPSLAGEIYVRSRGAEGYWYKWDIINNCSAPACFFGEPEHWRPVLKADEGRYKKLRINFCHFDPNGSTWTKQIISLMKDYDNVYADLSYYTEDDAISAVKDIVRDHPILAERLMFGTDFIMIMKEKKIGGLKKYFDRFDGLPGQMFYHNAQSFLGLGVN